MSDLDSRTDRAVAQMIFETDGPTPVQVEEIRRQGRDSFLWARARAGLAFEDFGRAFMHESKGTFRLVLRALRRWRK